MYATEKPLVRGHTRYQYRIGPLLLPLAAFLRRAGDYERVQGTGGRCHLAGEGCGVMRCQHVDDDTQCRSGRHTAGARRMLREAER